MPLEKLFLRLEAAGFDTSPRVRLLVWEALNESGSDYLNNIAELPYLLTPLLATSGRQQAQLYAIFKDFLDECQVAADTLPDVPQEEPGGTQTGSAQRHFSLWWMLLMLPIFGLLWWARIYFSPPEAPAPDFILPTELLREGDALRIQKQEGPAATVWEVKASDSGQLLHRDSSEHLEWVLADSITPLAGRYIDIQLLGAEAAPVSRQLRVHCANPPDIRLGPDFPSPGALVLGETYTLAVYAPPAAEVRWVVAGDTLAASRSTGSDSLFTFSLDAKDAGEVFAECTAYLPGAEGYCFTSRSFIWQVSGQQALLATAELKADTPSLIGRVAPWVWWAMLLGWLLPYILLGLWWRRLQEQAEADAAAQLSDEQLAVDFPIYDKAPYYIPYRSREQWISVPSDFYHSANTLRRRSASERYNFDAEASVQATIQGGGFPRLLEKADTQITDYLVLIEAPNDQQQQARLWERLSSFWVAQEAPLEVWLHDGSFRAFWQKGKTDVIEHLPGLYRRYPKHRLVLIGEGSRLVNPNQADKPALYADLATELLRWQKRLLLTPASPTDWTYYEKLFHRYFLLFPADTRGLQEGVAALDALEELDPGPYTRWEAQQQQRRPHVSHRYRQWQSPEDHQNYLAHDPEAYRWLCGLAVSAAPDWTLTLAIGRALGIPLTHDRLLVLTRIPWLNDNEDHTDLRLRFLRQLSAEDEKAARQAAIEELEAVRESVENSFAATTWTNDLAVQRFALDPHNEAHKALIQRLQEAGLLSHSQMEELDMLVQERIPRTGSDLPPEAYRNLKSWLEANPKALPTWSPPVVLAAVLSLLVIGTAALALRHNLQALPIAAGDTPAFWQRTIVQDDAALATHNTAVAIGHRQRMQEDGTLPSNAADSVQIADSLLRQAIALRNGNYPLADTNLLVLRYNYAAQSMNDFLTQNTRDTAQLPRLTALFRQVESTQAARPTLNSLALAALHGRGISYYYQYLYGSEATRYCDSARQVYQALLAADAQFFQKTQTQMQTDLQRLLQMGGCGDGGSPNAFITVINGSEICCAPCTIQFENSSINYTTALWDFGDGTTSSGRKVAPHIYTKVGQYTVLLVIDNGQQKSNVSKRITVLDCSSENSYVIHGVVRNNTSVVRNAIITTEYGQTRTNSQGRYVLKFIPPLDYAGNIKVSISASEHRLYYKSVLISQGDNIIDFVLDKIVDDDDLATDQKVTDTGSSNVELKLFTFDTETELQLNGCHFKIIDPLSMRLIAEKINLEGNSADFLIKRNEPYYLETSRRGYAPIREMITFKPEDVNQLENNIIFDVYLNPIPTPVDMFPRILYFDHTQPISDSVEYVFTSVEYFKKRQDFIQEFTEGMELEEAFMARRRFNDFFNFDVRGGRYDLEEAAKRIVRYLKEDTEEILELDLRGFSSPLESNIKGLSERRIASVINFFKSYPDLKQYIESGRILFKITAYGASKADPRVSSDARDLKNSVYNVSASLERRVEITAKLVSKKN